jgi:hypothetical protein
MKTSISYLIIAAAMACGFANGQTAYTTPVGYYNFVGVAGGNLFIPSLVNPTSFAGVLTGQSSTTLTLAGGSLVAAAYDKGAIYTKFYAEITSGPNAGVCLDIVSNTATVITLADNIAGLNLVGTESIAIRPVVTLKSSLEAAESSLSAYSDSATFYLTDGTNITYFYGADGGTGWSSDFAAADGNDRPVAPGTGFVLGLTSSGGLTVSGTVKSTATVAMLSAGNVNIVGQVKPLAGSSTDLNNIGFGSLVAYTDSITAYVQGGLTESTTYYPLGDGSISSDFATPTTDTIANTVGAVVVPSADTSVTLAGFTVGL